MAKRKRRPDTSLAAMLRGDIYGLVKDLPKPGDFWRLQFPDLKDVYVQCSAVCKKPAMIDVEFLGSTAPACWACANAARKFATKED